LTSQGKTGQNRSQPGYPPQEESAGCGYRPLSFKSLPNQHLTLPRQFLRNCRRVGGRPKVSDSTGSALTGNGLLLGTLVLRRILKREVLATDETFVGVLLPPSVGGVLVNAALPLMRRIAVNLNYTMSNSLINHCIAQCGIRHVLTSRRVLDKFKLQLDAKIVYVEDFREKATWFDKACAWVQSKLPSAILEKRLGIVNVAGDDLLTVMFTSGSTGDPKGVMLSHDNVASQIEAIQQAVQLNDDDVAMGVLPFFHLYGYTATMWTVLSLAPQGVYHFDPREAHEVGKLCSKHHVTVFMATPTFLRIYLRRVKPEDFRTLDTVFGAAEKLPKELSDAFEARFGMRPYEAYGCTELSPLVAVNIPPSRNREPSRPSAREGTVGRPIPGVRVKVVHVETGEDLPTGETGMLLVSGPNVMKGYFNRPDLTKKVIRDGWYVTGDLARIDTDGFIEITGRESRFSKIGGEMVPHMTVEEKLQRVLGGDEEHLTAVVTAVPDPFKGERLIVMHLPVDKSPEQIRRELAAAGLPNLWIPSADSFYEVAEIPVLGTGKLDLRRLKELALAKFSM
jgi:acyl-[acyl-carrier-protein]-phospholipid O-acyltransferase / long-chain-fatty-acid--[acyl-carrier-protein] ligase